MPVIGLQRKDWIPRSNRVMTERRDSEGRQALDIHPHPCPLPERERAY